jgi:hypothetical protein
MKHLVIRIARRNDIVAFTGISFCLSGALDSKE